jgi:hypothetical protein
MIGRSKVTSIQATSGINLGHIIVLPSYLELE